jgi:hypothetical protein
MTVKYVLAAALVLGLTASAFAADGSQFVIIKDKNKHCRIIQQNMVSDDQLTMQVGKQGYPTRDEANIDVKVLCDTP